MRMKMRMRMKMKMKMKMKKEKRREKEKSTTELGGECMAKTIKEGRVQSTEQLPPLCVKKSLNIARYHVGPLSDIKLIRTDTTLDHSQRPGKQRELEKRGNI